MAIAPNGAQPWVATLPADPRAARRPGAAAQAARTIDILAEKLPKTAEHLDAHQRDMLVFTAQRESGMEADLEQRPQERLTTVTRRHADVVGICPAATPCSTWSSRSWSNRPTNGTNDTASCD